VGTIGTIYLIEDIEFYFKDGNLLWIKDINDSVHPQYLAKYMASDVFQTAIERISGGSSQSALTIEKLSQLELNLPTLPEQQKIAQILTSVDEVIEKTQAQIDKLKDLKTGMMQELLTKGIGHVEFKDSPVGRIPVGWEVVPLKSLTSRITDGTHQAVKTQVGGNIPFLYVSCIRGGKILWEKASTLSSEVYEIASKGRKPVVGDVLYTAVGSYGNAALVTKDIPFSFQRHIAYIQPDRNIISPAYLVVFLNSPYGKKEADFYAIGNAQLTITLGDLGKFKLPIPPINEQLKISDSLSSIDKVIDKLSAKLQTIKNTKKALMQDLLTGKVRVKFH
jgi:type I restriction enzyme S subunit